jgi:integrase
VRDHLSLETGIIEVKLGRWMEIDLENIKRMSDDYKEMVEMVLRGLIDVVGDVPLTTIKPSDAKLWMNAMQRKKKKDGTLLAPTSINDYRRALQASFRRALIDGYILNNSFKEIRPLPEGRKLPIVLEKDELTAIRQLLPAWALRACDFLVMTGIRRGEALNLHWGDIDSMFGKIEIKAHGEVHPKFNLERELTISPAAISMLEKIRNEQMANGLESTHVFVDDEGKPIRPDRLTKEFREARKVVTTKPVNIHALRRTFATKLEQDRISPNTIKGLLGHKSLRTTERYLGSFQGEAAAAVRNINLSDFISPNE